MEIFFIIVGILLTATIINVILFRVLFKHLEQYKKSPWLSILHEVTHSTFAFGIIGLGYSLIVGFEEDMIWVQPFIYWFTALGVFSLISLQLAHMAIKRKQNDKSFSDRSN
ncbi:TPA: hypothetical protein ACGSTL_001213 [Vibrio parahaemolyticus]